MKNTSIEHRFPKIIKLQYIDDGVDGCLTVVESSKQIPFNIKRVYYINRFRNWNAIRGMHAHKKLKQAIFCLQGSFELLLDNGVAQRSIKMQKSHLGIYLAPMLWHVMRHFSKDCVILVLASDFYKKSDYIRDYNEFVKWLRRKL